MPTWGKAGPRILVTTQSSNTQQPDKKELYHEKKRREAGVDSQPRDYEDKMAELLAAEPAEAVEV